MSDDAARLEAARRRLVASFGAQQATDALLDVAGHLGLLGNALLNESLNRLSVTIQQARIEQQQAMSEYEDAFTDRMTYLVTAEHQRVTRIAEEERRRVYELLSVRHQSIQEIRDALHNMAELLGYPIITPASDALIVERAQKAQGARPETLPPLDAYRELPPAGHSDPDDPTGRS